MTKIRSAENAASFIVVAISENHAFHETIGRALLDLNGDAKLFAEGDFRQISGRCAEAPDVYEKTLLRSLRYLDHVHVGPPTLVSAKTLVAARSLISKLTDTDDGPHVLSLILLDTTHGSQDSPDLISGKLIADFSSSVAQELRIEGFQYSATVYVSEIDTSFDISRLHALRVLPDEEWVLAADVIYQYMEYVQNWATSPIENKTRPAVALAEAISQFLDERAGEQWGFHYYTGSVVSDTIDFIEDRAQRNGNPILRGPSEHSLACGALARWQLDESPFLIVVTSGMIDEFRGTLANLRDAKAQGLILCAESSPTRWLPFQGTVHSAEDTREVLRARNIPFVYIEDPRHIGRELALAFDMFSRGAGPVVILATASVLEHTGTVQVCDAQPSNPPEPAKLLKSKVTVVRNDDLGSIRVMLAQDPTKLLWQCGHLRAAESDLIHNIAEIAGVALADSTIRPGGVARYRNGGVVNEYLGTLGQYGYSSSVHQFLHGADGRVNPRNDQWLFFLKSRITEASTPFSELTLRKSFQIVQVTDDETHFAPFTDTCIKSNLEPFLRSLREGLIVDPEILSFRREAIRAAQNYPPDLASEIPVTPMTPNYFFTRLNALLEAMIRDDGYSYTGVFEVGRGGSSAIRNLSRTGPGFSGFYGRALMGDAIHSIPALAFSGRRNILAFVGDAAAALVPDIVPTLVQQACFEQRRLGGNVSIFRLRNGGHSMIRSYVEGYRKKCPSSQTRVLSFAEKDWEKFIPPINLSHRNIARLDTEALRSQLLDESAINLYSVSLSHNNEGDGISLMSSLSWQEDRLSKLTTDMARRSHRKGAAQRLRKSE
ncbi:hypothetical protein [Streptomyces sp. NPDC099088]|uniref:hypothetical protein n=1 Tax=Streptomyces sp. NPDC099088 TaxID=3366101 RepID=UPI00380AB5CC